LLLQIKSVSTIPRSSNNMAPVIASTQPVILSEAKDLPIIANLRVGRVGRCLGFARHDKG
jgi:hypothetical protein